MANVTIDIDIRDKFSNKLQDLQNKLNQIKTSASNINIGGSVSGGGRSGGSAGAAGGLSSLVKGFTLASLAAGALTESIAFLKREVLDAFQKFQDLERIQKTFGFAMSTTTGKLATIAGEVERLRLGDFAKEYGMNVLDLSDNYSKFLAATKGTNLSLAESRTLFEGTTKAAATYGLAQDQVSRIFKAYIDIVSKGKPQAEEIVRQLGNNLPGALNLMATSLGKTTGEFRELMKQGKLTSEILVQFGEYLNKTFDVSAQANVNTLTGKLNNLTNAFDELKLSLAAGFGPALITGINLLTTGIEKLNSVIKFFYGENLIEKTANELKYF
jgi:tape measure domain-containing protein